MLPVWTQCGKLHVVHPSIAQSIQSCILHCTRRDIAVGQEQSFKKRHPSIPFYLIVLSVTLLMICRLAQLFIFGLALGKYNVQVSSRETMFKTHLRVVFSVAGGAVFSLALVLVLLHTHLGRKIKYGYQIGFSSYLFMMRFTMRCGDILPLNVTVRFLQLLLKVIPDLSKEPSAGGYHKTCHIHKLHGLIR